MALNVVINQQGVNKLSGIMLKSQKVCQFIYHGELEALNFKSKVKPSPILLLDMFEDYLRIHLQQKLKSNLTNSLKREKVIRSDNKRKNITYIIIMIQ